MKFKKITIISLLLLVTLQSRSQKLTNTQLKDSITTILKETNTPNAFVTVVTKDGILFQSEFGYTTKEKKVNLDKNGLFAMGSISKTFTALAIMKLVNEGKLNLDDELKVIAPEITFHNKWEETHPVKIKHLLTHRSGFDDMHISALIKKRNRNFTALEEVLVYKKSYTTNWKPGLVFSYSNPSYIVLGYIIEKISGTTYQEYITQNILLPLKMNETTYYSLTKTENLVTGFKRTDTGVEASELPILIGESAGGMFSNGKNMANFLQFFLNENKQRISGIITPQLVTEMEKLQSDFEISNNITSGYSIGMYDLRYMDKKINFKKHNGSINGFSSDYLFNKDLNIGIAISRNLFATSNKDIIELLVNNFVDTSKITKIKSTNSTTDISKFKDWEGTYKMLSGTNNLVNFINAPLRTMKLKIKKDSLYVTRFMSDDEVYTHIENNNFKDVKEDFSTLFLCDNDNNKTLVFYEDTLVKINPLKHYVSLFLLFIGLFAGILVTLFFIVQLFMLPFKKSIKNSLKTSLMIGFPFWLIMGSIILYLMNSSFLDLNNLGNITVISVSLFLCTLLFPLFSIYVGYKMFKKQLFFKNNRFRIVYTFLFFGVTFLSLYSLYYGWFALRLWSY